MFARSGPYYTCVHEVSVCCVSDRLASLLSFYGPLDLFVGFVFCLQYSIIRIVKLETDFKMCLKVFIIILN